MKEYTNPDSLKFGDIVINHWASEMNPHRKGIVVSVVRRGVTCTDCEGDFWTVVNDKDSRFEKIGSLLLCEDCNGVGEVERTIFKGDEGMKIEMDVPTVCGSCNGSGKFISGFSFG